MKDTFFFRDLHPRVHLGTASDRYAGWTGQIYTPGRYEGGTTRRKRRLGGKEYVEEVLPVESVEEYFRHFSTLEIDFTFYRPLLDRKGEPTESSRVLDRYRAHIREGDRLFLKAPQITTAPQLRRGGSFAVNEGYLDPEIFTRQFYEPAVEKLGPNLAGIIFEQAYQRSRDREGAQRLAERMKLFFQALPPDNRYHLEMRTEAYLAEPLFEVLEENGVGQVLSHWTWLPSLREQFAGAGGRIFNGGGMLLLRLLTPRHVRYEETYARAFPFDKPVEGMMSPGMVEETVDIAAETAGKGRQVTVIVNNRAGGNAPLIARQIADGLKSRTLTSF